LDLERETEEELTRMVADVTGASETAPQLHVTTGPAVDVIVETAERLAADIIVIGSHGMSGTERLVFGSTTEGVLRRAPVSVLVTPPVSSGVDTAGADLSVTGPVVAAVDFSKGSVDAAKAACRLGSALRTTLELVHVVPQPPVLGRWRAHTETTVRERAEAARTQLDGLAESVACEVPTHVRVETGGVPSALAKAASPSERRRPILVMGRRSPGERGGAPGSTAYRVLMLARVPVLMYVERG
jgi:nucleotide-binding universal stress UspA family protein